MLWNADDLHRLTLRLVALRAIPCIQVRLDRLPELEVQRAQDRIRRLADRCHCVAGEMLAATTLLLGVWYGWLVDLSWSDAPLVLAAALGAGLAGKAVELLWTRVQLLAVLRRLNRALSRLPEGDLPAMPSRPRVVPAPLGASELLDKPSLKAEDYRAQPAAAAVRSVGQPMAVAIESTPGHVRLRSVADIDRLLRRVAIPWKLPVIEVQVDALSTLDVQRAQDRIAGLSRACNCVLAGLLGGLTLIAGAPYLVASTANRWDWFLGMGYSMADLLSLAAYVVSAAVIGWVVESIINRLRLAAVLLGLRRDLEATAAD